MRPHAEDGITITEILVFSSVAIVLVLILKGAVLPAITGAFTHSPGIRTLSNAKQLTLATRQMALNGETTGNTNLGWPGDTGGSYNDWVDQLVPAYLQPMTSGS